MNSMVDKSMLTTGCLGDEISRATEEDNSDPMFIKALQTILLWNDTTCKRHSFAKNRMSVSFIFFCLCSLLLLKILNHFEIFMLLLFNIENEKHFIR